MRRSTIMGLSLAFGMAGCAKPPVVAIAPPPAPVGHPYQVLVDIPPNGRILPVSQRAEVQQAFNVIGLKSALMVGALSCGQQDQYDAFMTSFQPHILAEQHVMDAYFKRGGRYGQAKEDDFVTLLANNQSVGGIAQGAVFCLNNQAEFQQVLALKTPDQLDDFVTDNSPVAIASTAPISVQTPDMPVHHHYKSHSTLKKSHPLALADSQP